MIGQLTRGEGDRLTIQRQRGVQFAREKRASGRDQQGNRQPHAKRRAGPVTARSGEAEQSAQSRGGRESADKSVNHQRPRRRRCREAGDHARDHEQGDRQAPETVQNGRRRPRGVEPCSRTLTRLPRARLRGSRSRESPSTGQLDGGAVTVPRSKARVCAAIVIHFHGVSLMHKSIRFSVVAAALTLGAVSLAVPGPASASTGDETPNGGDCAASCAGIQAHCAQGCGPNAACVKGCADMVARCTSACHGK